jgi:hypothetical protein
MRQGNCGKRRRLCSNLEGQPPSEQPARGFADKRQRPGNGKNGAKTDITSDVSVEMLKHSGFLQNSRNRITAPRANLSNDKFHQMLIGKTVR